jgi:hypothetical protein
MSTPDLGDDHLGGVRADPGDLLEALGRRKRPPRLTMPVAAVPVAAVPVAGRWRPGGRDRGDELADAEVELVDLGGQAVDLVEQDPGQLAVVVVELAVQRLGQGGALGPRRAAGQLGERPRVALPGDERLDHAPGAESKSSLHATEDTLISASSSSFSTPRPMPGPLAGQVRPQPGVLAQLPDLLRRCERGPQQPPLGELGQPHRAPACPSSAGPARSSPRGR